MQTIKWVWGYGTVGKTCPLTPYITDFHLSVYRLSPTTVLSRFWSVESHVLSDFVLLQRTRTVTTTTELWTNRCVSHLFLRGQSTLQVPEITHQSKDSFLAVGIQTDLRDDPSTTEKLFKNKQNTITPETAEKLARGLKAIRGVDCSACTQKGWKNVLEEATMATLEPPEMKSHRRTWLQHPFAQLVSGGFFKATVTL